MFKRILLATDGSPRSGHASSKIVVRLAEALGATIVAIHVRAPLSLAGCENAEIAGGSAADAALRERALALARVYLEEVERAARKARVPFEGIVAED